MGCAVKRACVSFSFDLPHTLLTIMTKHGAAHTELVELGFDIPSYDFKPVQHPGQPLSWEVVATLSCQTLNNAGELVMEAEGPSKSAACSEAAVQLLEAVRCLLPPQREVIRLRRGFISPKPVAMLSSGEGKEAKALVRKYGQEFLETAVNFYLDAGTREPYDESKWVDYSQLEPSAACTHSPPGLSASRPKAAPPSFPHPDVAALPVHPSYYPFDPPLLTRSISTSTGTGNSSVCARCSK